MVVNQNLAWYKIKEILRRKHAHLLHSLFSVPVGPYNPDLRLFGCRGELPSEGIPAITEIPVASFAVQCIVSAVPWDYQIVHVEGVSTLSWRSTPCERASGKSEGRNLAYRGLTFLRLDVAAPLVNVEGNIAEVSRLLFPRISGPEPTYKEALNWLQFSYTGNKKGDYVAPANTYLSFLSPAEGGSLFSPALECLRALYPGAYSQGATSTANLHSPEAMKRPHEGRESGARTHPGAAGLDLFLGVGDPSPIRAPNTRGAHLYLFPITHQPFSFGNSPSHVGGGIAGQGSVSTYGDQKYF